MANSAKKKRENEKHRRFIASLPCCVTMLEGSTQCAHIRHNTGGGVGMKPEDRWCVPLSYQEHARQHEMGEVNFWGDSLEDAKQLALDLWKNTGDEYTAMGLIRKFHDRHKWRTLGEKYNIGQ